MTKTGFLATTLAAASLLCATAASAGDGWMLRAGVHNVDPKSDNGSLAGGTLDVKVDSRVGPTVNIDYYLTPNLAIDVLGALPFKHDITVSGGANLKGSTQELPPTVSLQYHFMPGGAIDPYVAAGLNYTIFWHDKLNGGPGLDLKNSFGLAAQIGADFAIDAAKTWVIGVDLRYIDIDADAEVGGSNAGTVNIDPLAYGINIGYRIK